MRAIVVRSYGGPETLHLEEVQRPEPIPTHVLVRVVAAGVNPIDAKTRSGGGFANEAGPLPHIPGWEFSGVVEKTGFGVTRFRPGDEVFGLPFFPRPAQAYAEYVSAPSRQLALKPANLPHEQAAGLPLAGLTAWQLLVDTAGVRPGQRVLIHAAAGGVGHLAVQIARARGAYVIGTASAAKHDLVKELGADEVIDYTATSFEEAAGFPVPIETAIRIINQVGVKPGQTLLVSGASGGVGSAVIQVARERGIDVIGTAGASNQDYVRSLGAVPTTYGDGLVGRVRAIAPVDAALDLAGSGVIPQLIELTGDPAKVLSIADFSAPSHGAQVSTDTLDMPGALAEAARLFTEGAFHLPVDQAFQLEDAARAQAVSQAGHVAGRVIITV